MNESTTELAIWQPIQPATIPPNAGPGDIALCAKALSERDIRSITTAFASESYEMVSTFVWTRAITGLKKQVASLGIEFVGQMLGRADITSNSDPKIALSELDAISLAEELGMVTSTEAMRLKHSMEIVSHFSDSENANQDQMNPEEAVGVLRSCVASILGNPHIEPPLEFRELRDSLESESLGAGDPRVAKIEQSPYFFQRTIISVLLSLLKTKEGAQLEHAVGNANVILPSVWPKLRAPERWQVGQVYAEVHSAGKRGAATGLKNALATVKGFDFVPESLRSDTFARAAHNVKETHFSMNNFYREAPAIQELAMLGTTIPQPAFPVCMTAILCVRLGNRYGVAWAAQPHAESLLKALRKQQREYFLNHCLARDNTILDKLQSHDPAARWIKLCSEFHSSELDVRDPKIRSLVSASNYNDVQKARNTVRRLNQSA